MKKLKEFAEKLNGRQYRNEITSQEIAFAKQNGIVVVFGASDDLIEFEGAICDERDAYNGETFWIAQNGVVYNCINKEKSNAHLFRLEAIWCPKDTSYSWGYETDIPHETFTIMEDNEHYCKGIVFYLKDLKPKRTNYDKITETAESLAEFIIFVVNESKNQRRLVSKILKDKNGKNELKKTIKEWLQKECDDEKRNMRENKK